MNRGEFLKRYINTIRGGFLVIVQKLKRKLGEINPSLETKIMQLSIDDVEVLGEALFDFSTVEDLINWLNTL
uniref:Similar to tr/Q4BZJ2/Q4BZJ2_CROWT Hypothetical protein n=1 Tax=Microcystis aeruginosa (strain PCC 7806) TaxID=267872 RepID=A8YCZ1_MICA7|nr:unnamed protein product [Microcystis aeruginosa PCC 7806]